MFQWQEMSIFSEPVNNDQDYIAVVGHGQPLNEIQGDILPGTLRYGQWLEEACRVSMVMLSLLTNHALFDKVFHILRPFQ